MIFVRIGLESIGRDSSSKRPMAFYVMRHFERGESPEYNAELTREGRVRAQELYIPGVTRVVSSPFRRCAASVSEFASSLDEPLRYACALGEFIDDDAHGIGREGRGEMERRVREFIAADAECRKASEGATLYVTHKSIAEMIAPGEVFDVGCVACVNSEGVEEGTFVEDEL